jgi:hypothetical protein
MQTRQTLPGAPLAALAETGMVRAVPEQTSGDVVWLALPPVGEELLRLEAILGS